MRANLRRELVEVVAGLESMIEVARDNWRAQQAQWGGTLPAERALSADGRPLLADLVVAKANALVTLARLDGPS